MKFFAVLSFFAVPPLISPVSILDAPLSNLEYSVKYEKFDPLYPRTNISRVHVPQILRGWDVNVSGYDPPYIIHPSVLGQRWADPEQVGELIPKFNTVHGPSGEELDRRCAKTGKYIIDPKTGRPLNQFGRTGVIGRGLLGRWGPNHSGLLVISRWFRDQDEIVKMPTSKKPLLEFIAVKYYGQYAIPGGFAKLGETYMKTCEDEFLADALHSANMTFSLRTSTAKHLAGMIYDHGHFIYRGYIMDNRNTDNAWIEGAVMNVHDSEGKEFLGYVLSPGDGVEEAKWLIAHRDMNCHPTHKEYLRVVTEVHSAHW